MGRVCAVLTSVQSSFLHFGAGTEKKLELVELEDDGIAKLFAVAQWLGSRCEVCLWLGGRSEQFPPLPSRSAPEF